ncbi:hypothetical protein [Streptomyces axinellae]|uniref:hypothetical protein n=1 Tax=Streptomyces axinellae TaxID=552788 RepID=UPI0031DC089A
MTRIDEWTLGVLPRFNQQIPTGQAHVPDMVAAMNSMLTDMPSADTFSLLQKKQLLVLLGIWGSSAVRHSQERSPYLRDNDPSEILRNISVGGRPVTLKSYFRQLADSSATGHPYRDAYASLVRWGTPASAAFWNGEKLVELPSVFPGGPARTYTDDPGEHLILELFKRAETLERAANLVVEPLWAGSEKCSSREAQERLFIATNMLLGVHRLFLDFPQGDARGKLTVDHFVDVFRQYAVHWEIGDVPPSGPQDVEFVSRDLMSGFGTDSYRRHVWRIFPGLLAEERDRLRNAMDRPSLPELLMTEAGVTGEQLTAASTAELSEMVRTFPSFASLFYFLNAGARLSAIHLAIAKKYLFKEIRARQRRLAEDSAVVPNDAGITGLEEKKLDELHRARHQHFLRTLSRISHADLQELSRVRPVRQLTSQQARDLLGLGQGPDEHRFGAVVGESGRSVARHL